MKGSFERITTRLNMGAGVVAGGLIVTMMLVIVVDVAGRYLLNRPLLGSIELNRTLLVAVIFLGFGYTQLCKRHIRVDMLILRLRKAPRLAMEGFSLSLALVVSLLVVYMVIPATYHSVIIREYEDGVIPFPMWPARLSLLAGLVLFVIQLVSDIIGLRKE